MQAKPVINLPVESLPWQILAVLLVGFFAVIIYTLSKAGEFKSFAQDFPTQPAVVIGGLGAFTFLVLIAGSRLALGMAWPDGYGDVAWLVGSALAGGMAGLGLKRFSDERYVEAKARGKATAAATVAAASTPGVNVEGNANITSERSVASAGVRPSDPDVVAGIEAIAAQQRAPAGVDDTIPEPS